MYHHQQYMHAQIHASSSPYVATTTADTQGDDDVCIRACMYCWWWCIYECMHGHVTMNQWRHVGGQWVGELDMLGRWHLWVCVILGGLCRDCGCMMWRNWIADVIDQACPTHSLNHHAHVVTDLSWYAHAYGTFMNHHQQYMHARMRHNEVKIWQTHSNHAGLW